MYVIAAFFFSRRRQLISELAAYLPPEQTNVVKRLLDCPDARIYLTSGRLSGATKAWAGDKYLDLSQIMEERETTGKELFERLMQHHPNGNVPGEMRALAHQLDMMIHGDLNSLGRVAIYAPSAAAHSSSSTRTLYLTGRPAKCRLHLCPGPLRPTHRLRIRQAANSGLMRARSSIRVGLGLPLTWSGPWLARFDLHRRLA